MLGTFDLIPVVLNFTFSFFELLSFFKFVIVILFFIFCKRSSGMLPSVLVVVAFINKQTKIPLKFGILTNANLILFELCVVVYS